MKSCAESSQLRCDLFFTQELLIQSPNSTITVSCETRESKGAAKFHRQPNETISKAHGSDLRLGSGITPLFMIILIAFMALIDFMCP